MLLTAKDVQSLINVDKSTIYRMAEDGRLPAIKVGRQWRFPADRIAEFLGDDVVPAAASEGASRPSAELATLLVPEAAQAIADLAADLFGVMAVVTDMEGRALTSVANPCGYFDAVANVPGALAQCIEGWRRLASEVDLEPKFIPSHLGFLCARTFIRVGNDLVGMLIVGGVTPKGWPPSPDEQAAIAAELGIDGAIVAAHIDETYYLDDAHQQWVLGLLPRLSDIISRLATARAQLVSKLDAIAVLAGGALSRVDNHSRHQRSTQ